MLPLQQAVADWINNIHHILGKKDMAVMLLWKLPLSYASKLKGLPPVYHVLGKKVYFTMSV